MSGKEEFPRPARDFHEDGEYFAYLLDMRDDYGTPEDIKRVMEHYCWLCKNKEPIPEQIKIFIGRAFWHFLGGGDKKKEVTLDKAFKLNKSKSGRPRLSYDHYNAYHSDPYLRNYYDGILEEGLTSEMSIEIYRQAHDWDQDSKKNIPNKKLKKLSKSAFRDRIKNFGQGIFIEALWTYAFENHKPLNEDQISRLTNNALYKKIFPKEGIFDDLKQYRKKEADLIKNLKNENSSNPY